MVQGAQAAEIRARYRDRALALDAEVEQAQKASAARQVALLRQMRAQRQTLLFQAEHLRLEYVAAKAVLGREVESAMEAAGEAEAREGEAIRGLLRFRRVTPTGLVRQALGG